MYQKWPRKQLSSFWKFFCDENNFRGDLTVVSLFAFIQYLDKFGKKYIDQTWVVESN